MDKWLFTFFLGALLSLFLPIVPAIFHIVLLLSLALALIITKQPLHYTGFLFGGAWILYQGVSYQNDLAQFSQANGQLSDSNFFLKSHVVQGEVLSLIVNKDANNDHQNTTKSWFFNTLDNEQPNKRDLRFNLQVTHLNYLPLNKPIIIRLRWLQPDFSIAQGDIVQFAVKLKPAYGLANSGGFNYQVWLRYKEISATGYIRQSKNKKHVNQLIVKAKSFRQQQYEKITQQVPAQPLRALLLALTLGERGHLTTQQWHILKATGTQHLIAISGLHLGLVAMGVFLLVAKLLLYLPVGIIKNISITRLNHHYLAICVSLLVTLFYAALSGFAVPTLRAIFMLSLYWLARLQGIKLPLARWFLLVIFVVLLTEPMSLLSASFWLSFYAVLVIFIILWRSFLFYQHGQQHWLLKAFKTLLLIQLGLTIFLLPVTLIIFHQFSPLSFIANLIAVPLMSLTAIPLSLAGVLVLPLSESIAEFLFSASLYFLEILWQWLSFLAQQPWALVSVDKLTITLISFAVAFVAAFYFWQIKWRYSAYFLPVLLVFTVNHFILNKAAWQLTVLDVGHGLAIVVNRGKHAVLYDTGAKYPSGFNMSEAVIIPFLQQQNIKEIDHLFISHNDNDHLGGLAILQNNITINRLHYNDKLAIKASSPCLQGQVFTWQNLTFTQLWPNSLVYEHNDDSCVIKISDGKYKILLTGDISKKTERYLVKTGIDLRADVLIVPHHGSKSSSSEGFIQAVSPHVAIFSNGYLNRWQMPTAEVLRRYHQRGIKTYSTANDGMISLLTTDKDTKIVTYRRDLFPYWFAN